MSNSPSIPYQRFCPQANNYDASNNVNNTPTTTAKYLPILPMQDMPSANIPNSKNVYQSLSTTNTVSSSSSSIKSRVVMDDFSIVNSRSNSDSSISSSSDSSLKNDTSSSSILSKVDIEDDNTSLTPISYDDSDENTLNSSFKKTSISGESTYDLSYYFHPDQPMNASSNSLSPTNTIVNEEKTIDEKENIIKKSNNPLYRARSLSIGSTMSSNYIISNASVKTASGFNKYDNPTAAGSINNDDDDTVVDDIRSESYNKKPVPNCKLQQFLLRKKIEKSNKKAYQFFGEQVKLEISVKEIRKEGLKALLYSSVPLGYFLYHLLNEYSSENLFFYLAVENYQNYNFSSDAERQQVANKISRSYLTKNSEVEVNLEDQIYRKVKRALIDQQQKRTTSSTGNEFDSAKRHIFSLLNVSYYRFRTSTIWDIMESKCNDLNSYDRERSQALVVNLLLTYIKRNNSPALSKLVHSFCKIYLPFGYESRLSSSNSISKENNAHNNRRNRSKSLSGNNIEKKNSNSFLSNTIDTFFFSKANRVNRY